MLYTNKNNDYNMFSIKGVSKIEEVHILNNEALYILPDAEHMLHQDMQQRASPLASPESTSMVVLRRVYPCCFKNC